MKKLLDKISFEYIFLCFIAFEAILLLEFSAAWTVLLPLSCCAVYTFFCNKVKGFCCAAGIILCWLFFQINLQNPHDSLVNKLNSRPIYGKIRFEIIDPLRCKVNDISNGATTLIRINSITDLSGTVYSGGGNFLLFARDLPAQDAFYGDVYEVTGTLRQRSKEFIWDADNDMPVGDFRFGDFQTYMKLHDIDGMISPDKKSDLRKISVNDSLFRRILQLRDNTLEYMVKNMRNKENKNTVAALFFGLKGALSPADKAEYIKSGTIHLFSVSGLHVGILFAILLPLLSFLPVNRRYLCASLLLIPFLLTTGANVPAVRAFLMILLFSLLRFFYFHVPSHRILALGCAFFLIFRADNLWDAGFLYSFGITGILLAISHGGKKWHQIWNTDINLMAVNRKNPEKIRKTQRFMPKMIYALCSTCAAFAGSSLISLFTFGYLYLSAVWINFFILFYCTWLIYVFIGKVLLSPFRYGAEFAAYIFDKSLDIMREAIEFGASYPCQLNVIQISWLGVIIFYFALIAVLCIREKKIFVTAIVTVIMFFPFNSLLIPLQKSEILTLREPSDGKVAFVLANPQARYAWAFNLRSTGAVEKARKFLASKGLNHINIYIVSGSSSTTLNALSTAAENIRIGKIVHITRYPFKKTNLPVRDSVYENICAPQTKWMQKEKLNTFFVQKSKIGFEYFNPQAIIPLCAVFDLETNILEIRQGRKIVKKELPNSNITEYSLYEL